METQDYTQMLVKLTAKKVGIDLSDYDMDQICKGMSVELEHGSKNPETNITDDDPLSTLKIVIAHLKENPNYYTELSSVDPQVSELPKEETEEVLDSETSSYKAPEHIVAPYPGDKGFPMVKKSLRVITSFDDFKKNKESDAS